MQELEREKDSLQLQVNVLEDQIEGQARRISDLGNMIQRNYVLKSGFGEGGNINNPWDPPPFRNSYLAAALFF